MSGEIQESLWIYGSQHQFRVTRRVITEIIEYMNTINIEHSDDDSILSSDNWVIEIMHNIFYQIEHVLLGYDLDNFYQNDMHILDNLKHNLVDDDEYHS